MLNNIFRSFSTELWPLIDVEKFIYAQYLVDQLMDFDKICKCIDIDKM